ncbi:MAG: outer membrane beta-barrel protein [Planctomycetia bacterium]|nr:outer membrane beta-barrel protein [Planctomycetia bacterium]
MKGRVQLFFWALLIGILAMNFFSFSLFADENEKSETAYQFSGHSLMSYFDGYNAGSAPLEMDQTWLTFQKDLSADPQKVDWGFQSDFLFGTSDASSYGDSTFDGDWTRSGGGYGFSFLNLYGSVGNKKCNLILGKFLTPLGYEMYSRAGFELCSYNRLTFHEGLTHTGGLLQYQINDQWSAKFGIAMGDDVGFGNRYGDSQILCSVRWDPVEKISICYSGSWAHYHPEHDAAETARLAQAYDYTKIFGKTASGETDFYKQTVLVQIKLTDHLNFNTFTDYGSLEECRTNRQLYEDFGIGSYLIWQQNKQLRHALRFAWYREEIREESAKGIDAVSYYEISAGTTIQLKDHFMIRPELRYDYAFEEKRSEGFTLGTIFGVVF